MPNLCPVLNTAESAIWAAIVPSKVSGLVSQVSQFPQGSQVSSKYSSSICRRQIAASHNPSRALSFWFRYVSGYPEPPNFRSSFAAWRHHPFHKSCRHWKAVRPVQHGRFPDNMLQLIWDIHVGDITHIGFVNPHTKGDGRDNNNVILT